MKKTIYTLLIACIGFLSFSQTSVSNSCITGSGTASFVPVFTTSKKVTKSEISQLGLGFNSIISVAGAKFRNRSIDLTGNNSYYPGELYTLSTFADAVRITNNGSINSTGTNVLKFNTTCNEAYFGGRTTFNTTCDNGLINNATIGIVNNQPFALSVYSGTYVPLMSLNSSGVFHLDTCPLYSGSLLSGDIFKYADAGSPSGYSIGIMP